MNNEEETLKPRIYVACLAAYNNGILRGDWIDADRSEDEIYKEIQKILKSSPIEGAEEFAIHDYDEFYEAELSEYPGIETVAKVGAFLVEHGRLGAKVFNRCCHNLEEAREMMEERYIGAYEKLQDYVREYIDECWDDFPPYIEPYFDYDRLGEELEMNGVVETLKVSFEQVHVFRGS